MPLFDIHCNACEKDGETIGESHALKCPCCGSPDVRRLWTIGWWYHRDPYNIHGSTPGVRARGKEIMRLENEKVNDKYYG